MLPVLVDEHGVQIAFGVHGRKADDMPFLVKGCDIIVYGEKFFPMLYAVSAGSPIFYFLLGVVFGVDDKYGISEQCLQFRNVFSFNLP